ncbi:MAG: magnesium transporter [Candidatus Liptonbacteria bacterium]|nr:magnesium transporter [Candidatus Liptonbacteria bacterium]
MDAKQQQGYTEEDVITERVDHLIEHRVPWLLVGILGGLFATLIIAGFETFLSADIRLAFFIPVIVYLSDAVGTQTETIFVRELSERKVGFLNYIAKESVIGFGLGIISGALLGGFAAYWLRSSAIGLTVGLTMLINLTLAPVLAVLIPNILYKRHADPALGAGPVATIIQDLISLLVYFLVAGIIIF